MDVILIGPIVRSHWSIENSLHWVMDMRFRDDECRVRTEHAPANFTAIKRMAHNMLRIATSCSVKPRWWRLQNTLANEAAVPRLARDHPELEKCHPGERAMAKTLFAILFAAPGGEWPEVKPTHHTKFLIRRSGANPESCVMSPNEAR
jgi:hypothetical protein